jgi:Zn-dependent M28 family amino/carboxypeptidase
VVGVLPGSDPALAAEYVVFTAHLDHLGKGAAVNGDTIYNGAMDNASGTAVMLEAARLLATGKTRPKRSIIFLAVTAEERGLLGSRHFAMYPTVPKDAIVANVNMDMPMTLFPMSGFTAFGAEHSTLGEVARRAIEAEGIDR